MSAATALRNAHRRHFAAATVASSPKTPPSSVSPFLSWAALSAPFSPSSAATGGSRLLMRPLCVEDDRSCFGTLHIQYSEEMESFWDTLVDSCPDVLVGEEELDTVGGAPAPGDCPVLYAQLELCSLFSPSMRGLVFPLRHGLELRVQGTPAPSSGAQRIHLCLQLVQRRVTVVLDLDHTMVHATSNFDESAKHVPKGSHFLAAEDLHVLELRHTLSAGAATTTASPQSSCPFSSSLTTAALDSFRFVVDDEDTPPPSPMQSPSGAGGAFGASAPATPSSTSPSSPSSSSSSSPKRPGTPPSCESLPPLWSQPLLPPPAVAAAAETERDAQWSSHVMRRTSGGVSAGRVGNARAAAALAVESELERQGSGSQCPSGDEEEEEEEEEDSEQEEDEEEEEFAGGADAAKETILVKVRPGARELISWLSSLGPAVEVVVCSAGVRAYVEAVVDLFDVQRNLIRHVFSREDLKQHCQQVQGQQFTTSIKDLSTLGLHLCSRNTVVLDDRPDVWVQHHNVLRVEPFVHFECDQGACEAAVASCLHSGRIGCGFAASLKDATALLAQFVHAWRFAERPDCFSWCSFVDRSSFHYNHHHQAQHGQHSSSSFQQHPSPSASLFGPVAQKSAAALYGGVWDSLGGSNSSGGSGNGSVGNGFFSSNPPSFPLLEGSMLLKNWSLSSDMDIWGRNSTL